MDNQEQQAPPRLKAVPMELNPDLMIGVSAKGGAALYGLRRFPFVFYATEILAILDVGDEIRQFLLDHADLLSNEKPGSTKAGKVEPERKISVTDAEVAILDAEITRLKGLNDFDGAVKYATIKANARGGKLPIEDMLEVYQLKARK